MRGKILIVEDDVDLAKMISIRFRKRDFEVFVAHDGLSGWETAKKEQPELIILDLMLPKLPGEEVCRRIRKDAVIGETPIIMLTAKNTEADRVIGRVIGADCYMEKPFDIEELFGKVDELI